jgi:S1-C subfamily serine protease
MPQVLVSGQLASIGSPVFNASGEAIGFVNLQPEQPIVLNDPKAGLSAVSRSPVIFIASPALMQSIADPPKGQPLQLPWLGVIQMVGLTREVAEYFGLKGQTAVQLGDIIPGGPADRAGLKPGQIITAVNGSPIPRGDEPEELPMIMRRQTMRMPVGQEVKLTVMDPRTRQSQVISVKLEDRPKQPNLAKRFFAEDLGFSVRELVFMDAYTRRLDPGSPGVLVSLIRPQSSAQNARLEGNDMVVELNGRPVMNLEQFQKDYEQFRKERPRDAVVLVVLREGRNQTIRIEPPQ